MRRSVGAAPAVLGLGLVVVLAGCRASESSAPRAARASSTPAANAPVADPGDAAVVATASDGGPRAPLLPPSVQTAVDIFAMNLDPVPESYAWSDKGDAWLVGLRPLRVLHHGRGSILGNPPYAVVGHDSDARRFLVAWLLPRGAHEAIGLRFPDQEGEIENIDVTDSGRFAVVTTYEEKDDGRIVYTATDYEVGTNRRIGEGLPHTLEGVTRSVTVGDEQLGFRGDVLARVDLATGRTERQVRVPCREVDELGPRRGNPVVDAALTRLVVTCNGDGLVFDARTLVKLRTIPHLVPGCDDTLPAHFADDGRTLVITACDGEARVDVTSGRYLCGDSDVVMGQPDWAAQTFGAKPTPKRHGVPSCQSPTPSTAGAR